MDFFDKATSFFDLLWQLLSNSIESLGVFFELMFSAIAVPNTVSFIMPPIIGASLSIVMAVAVVKLITSLLPF